jgi:hypothetical protein
MNFLKGAGAVLLGLLVIFALSHITDVVLEKSGLMLLPFDSNPLWLKLFVTFYRTFYVFVGGYVTARVSYANPMRHTIILASIGSVLGILGAVAMWSETPHWYPIALIILGWPSAWLGGKLRVKN